MEMLKKHANRPEVVKTIISFTRGDLAEIDWLEQTHGLIVEVNPEILKAIGKFRVSKP